MGPILVAGVTGALGAEVARQLIARGHTVRGLLRDEKRLPAGIALSSKHLGDLLRPSSLAGAADGIECVFSAVGASVSPELGAGWRSYTAIDTPANLALLTESRRAGVKRFVYVSSFHTEPMRRLNYIRAHEDVVTAVKASGLAHSIIRPTGFFCALAGLLPLARKGQLPSFNGGVAKSNPIHELDLAAVCVEGIEQGAEELPAGGPEVLSRKEMNALACAAVGKPEKSIAAPLWALKAASVCAIPFHPRMAQLLEFLAGLSENDAIAPVRGTRRLGDYFAEVARKSSRT